VLVVEDAHPFRRLIREVVAGAGYRVLEAATPGEALELAEDHGDEIDLVLTDVVMPEMHGHELAAVLRARLPRLRVVYMSGFSEEIVSAAERAEFPFLQKPFSSELLLRTLRETLAAPPPNGGG
jgi:CheY-like chemotaxis protein